MVADVPMSHVMGRDEFLSYAPATGPGTPGRTEPSAEEVVWTMRARVLVRLAETHQDSQKKLASAVRGAGSAAAKVRAESARFALAQRSIEAADVESFAVRNLADPPASVRYDTYSRPLGHLGYVLALCVCSMGEFMIARGSLQGLGFSPSLSAGLILTAVGAQTLGAHMVGRLLRRRSDAHDPHALSYERVKMVALIVQIAMVTFAMPLLGGTQGVFGARVFGPLMLAAAGGALVLSTITASYLHASSRLDAMHVTERALLRAGKSAALHGRALLTAEARYIEAVNQMQAVAADVVGRVELVYTTHQVDPASYEEPTWVAQLRCWARGENLPFELADLLPVHESRRRLDGSSSDRKEAADGRVALDTPETEAQSA